MLATPFFNSYHIGLYSMKHPLSVRQNNTNKKKERKYFSRNHKILQVVHACLIWQARMTVQFFCHPHILAFYWNTIRGSCAIYVILEIYGVQSARPDCPPRVWAGPSPVQQAQSTLQAELWGLCSLELCSAAPRRGVNDGRPDAYYDFFLLLLFMIFRRGQAMHMACWWHQMMDREIHFGIMFTSR